MSHQAAIIPEKFGAIQVSSTPTPKPDADSVLVRVKAVAINPVDHVVQSKAYIIEEYPAILGSDAAGVIEEVGSKVTKFQKGDRVLVSTLYLLTKQKEQAGFQEIIVAPQITVSKIPDSMSFVDASVLPLSLATASVGLYTSTGLGLSLPSVEPKPSGKKLLIWGGSSSVGAGVIQLAIASGLDVVVTASPKNFDYLKTLGKAGNIKLFDYNSPTIVGDLVEELGDASAGAYDAIATRDTNLTCATVLAQLGGGKIASVLDPPEDEIPATVESKMVYAPMIFGPDKQVGEAVFGAFLPQALAKGLVIPAPGAEIVGKGLDSIQGAINKYTAGVSAKKLVVEL